MILSLGRCTLLLALVSTSAPIAMTGETQKLPKRERATTVRFSDIRASAGITFLQDSTQSPEKYYLETMGTGVAWIDYDQDGLLDLFFVQSGVTDAYKPDHLLHSALYQQRRWHIYRRDREGGGRWPRTLRPGSRRG